MQGRSRLERDLWDAGEVTGHLVPPGSVFAFLAEHRGELFPDEFTADLFPSQTGRPSLPADLVGSVLVLKELYDLPDTQTADALKFDLRWKVACGRSLLQVSFDPSTLVYWRKRIAASSRPDRVFGAVAQVIAETGILRGRRKRCVDSTVFDDAVATQDTVTQLVAAMRRVARVVAGAAEGSDGTDGRWVIARRVAPDRVISTVDPQARHTRKSRSNRRDGYRGHLATEPDTGLITDCEMTMTTGEANTDAAVGVKMANRDRFHPTDTDNADTVASTADTDGEGEDTGDSGGGLEVYGDSAYGTGEARDAYRAAGHDVVIKPKPLPSAVPGGFTLDDFTIDDNEGTVTCPNGNTRPMSPARTVTFGRLCAGCPLRQRCTTAKSGRSMTIHPQEGLLRAARAQAKTPRFKQDYPTRSNIERTVAQVATQNGPDQAAPHRRREEQRLAAHPLRRAQPTHSAQVRPHPCERGLGDRLKHPTRRPPHVLHQPPTAHTSRREPQPGRSRPVNRPQPHKPAPPKQACSEGS